MFSPLITPKTLLLCFIIAASLAQTMVYLIVLSGEMTTLSEDKKPERPGAASFRHCSGIASILVFITSSICLGLELAMLLGR
jgi:hypothetical protein